MMNSDDLYAPGRALAFAGDEYANAVTEAAGVHRCAVARLVSELLNAETMAAAARIKVQLTAVQNQYEAALIEETVALQARRPTGAQTPGRELDATRDHPFG